MKMITALAVATGCLCIPALQGAGAADQQQRYTQLEQLNTTNAVGITSNLFLFLSSERHHGWATNIFKSNDRILHGMGVKPLHAAGTNMAYVRYLALRFQASFDFKLFDSSGREIEKTALGVANSKPAHSPQSVKELDELKPQVIRQETVALRELFRPDDMFVITNTGVYELVLRMRICVPMTNGVPDLEAMQFSPGKNVRRQNANYENILSPPLRVRVIKD
jgi:hypothetical protein